MNASLQVEDDARYKKTVKTRQQIYREELDAQLKDKQQSKVTYQKEDNIWLNMEQSQMDR